MGQVTYFLNVGTPSYLARNFKFGTLIGHWGPNEKMQN